MLTPYRVLDLCDEHGLLCGQLLADLGADVIQVEPPGGSSARSCAPFYRDERGPDRSLFFWAYARNKRSVALDLDSATGRARLRALAAGADFLIESETPGRMAALGLGYDDLAAANPGLVYVSISPFGQLGPKAGWAATDLTIAAAAGTLYLNGDGGSPPVRVSVPQSHAHAGADAAVGALIAHFERRRTGRGQHVDISAQQSLTLATMFRSLDAPLGEVPATPVAGGAYVKGVFLRTRYALRDGWVVLGPGFLPSTGHFMQRLLRWAAEEGEADPALAEIDWNGFAIGILTGALGDDAYDATDRTLEQFFGRRTKADLMGVAVEKRLLLAPILSLGEIAESEQLAKRAFATPHAHPELDETIRYPGPFAHFSASPWSSRRPPPRLDEHGDEIRSESPRRPAFEVGSAPGAAADAPPLDGVKILDLFWVLAGPGATRMLADYGATVVHVESTQRLDTLRVIPPYQFNNPHPEGAGGFQSANATKLGLTLDLAHPEARDIALELVRWADVVTESFAPGVIHRYGLGYEALREVRPDVIMISSCLMGQTGPWKNFTGFGNLAASVTGFQLLAGWPGRPPSGPYGAYTDFISVRYNALSILAALEHRERTGEGQYIDQSQAEASLHFLAPAYLDYTVHGRVPEAVGNEDGGCFPHDVFPTRGEDQWIAIAVRDDREWRALCETMDRPDLETRRDERALATEAIRDWTRECDADELAARLQAQGVPAHAALDTTGLYACPQLQSREHYLEAAHEIYGTTTIESSRLVLSRSRSRRPERAMEFGRDNRAVLEGILGYTPEQIAGFAERGVLR